MNDAERDALLIRLDERTLREDKVLFGNGQPGVLDRLSKIEQKVNDIDVRTPSKKEKLTNWAGLGTALVLGISAALKGVWGL